jgi:hypothetical protein
MSTRKNYQDTGPPPPFPPYPTVEKRLAEQLAKAAASQPPPLTVEQRTENYIKAMRTAFRARYDLNPIMAAYKRQGLAVDKIEWKKE